MEHVSFTPLIRSHLIRIVLAVGTGEHGVGVGKKDYLPDELGEGTVELMRIVKRAVDPLNLFNPGKVCRIIEILEATTSNNKWQLYPEPKEPRLGKT